MESTTKPGIRFRVAEISSAGLGLQVRAFFRGGQMGVSTSGQWVHLEQRNGAPGRRPATTTDEALRRDYERRVRQLLDALEARLLGLPPEEKFAAIDAVAAAVEHGKQVTIRVKPLTVRV